MNASNGTPSHDAPAGVDTPVPAQPCPEATAPLSLYRTMVLSRAVESVEETVISRGEGHFHIASAGHESTAALAEFLGPQDWLACHYRDRALMLARGMEPRACFDALLANDASSSRGRQMNVMQSSRALKILSMPVSVGNNLLPAVGIAAQVKDEPGSPLVYASVGDGTAQQGDFFEAVGEAVRSQLPVLFLVQDNGYALSTTTIGKTFFSLPEGEADSFLGLPIHRMDGVDPLACRETFSHLCNRIRETRGPVLAIMRAERLGSHSNADDQSLYRSAESLAENASGRDPIKALRAALLESGVEESELEAIESACQDEAQAAAKLAREADAPQLSLQMKAPLPKEYREREEAVVVGTLDGKALTMREAIGDSLKAALSNDPAVYLYGEDIEDPKGDVFGVTKGLSKTFPGRVVNSPLAEASILGLSIGRAMAGARPVAFIQFADFLPLIQNLYHNELASMFWRTDGEWQCPVLLMVSCGGYRPGTGPFHTQTLEAALAHTPGVDIVMPSSAYDAAGLLNAALTSPRPTVFLYPKNLINDSRRVTSGRVPEQWVPVGRARKTRDGGDVTLVGWGNTAPLCEEAAASLAELGIEADVLDLRSITPWDEEAVLASVAKTGRLIVAHEDNRFAGVGAEIVATVSEASHVPVRTSRVTRPDAFAPFNLPNQLEMLPSVEKLIEAAASLMDREITWQDTDGADGELEVISAIGVGASDDTVNLIEWLVKEGDEVEADQMLALFEAEKAAGELLASSAGTVEKLLVDEGKSVRIGTPIMHLRRSGEATPAVAKKSTGPRRPVLSPAPAKSEAPARVEPTTIRLAGVSAVLGDEVVSNERLLEKFPDKSSEEIVKMTGIVSRNWASPEQTLLSMAVEAAENLFADSKIKLEEIDLVLCATTTPDKGTPSLAMRVMHELAPEHECPGYDISAACSGYLYGLHAARSFLLDKPDGRVLLITAETLSRTLDLNDYNTAILFGDAATATLVTGDSQGADTPGPGLRMDPPVISGKGESGEYLRVPLMGNSSNESIAMHGKQVFHDAVRRMAETLDTACAASALTMNELDIIIPHQANQRIIRALGKRMRLRPGQIWDNIRDYGNTSSCSIPLCLAQNWGTIPDGAKVALVAFGGGFTYGAAILRK